MKFVIALNFRFLFVFNAKSVSFLCFFFVYCLPEFSDLFLRKRVGSLVFYL